MLKAAIYASVLAAIVFVAAFFAFLSWNGSFRSPRQEQQQHQNEPNNPNGKADQKMSPDGNQESNHWSRIKKKAQEYRDRFIEHVEHRDKVYVALSGIAVAAFTLALFVATFLLWFAGERHSERQLRAYVFPERASITGVRGGKPPHIEIVLTNSGQTPAYHVRHRMRAGFRKRGDADYPLTADDPWDSVANFAPRTPVRAGSLFSRAITEEDHAAIDKSETYFCVYGKIEYEDAFGHIRWTKYKYVLDKRAGLSDGDMWVAEDGNEADSPK